MSTICGVLAFGAQMPAVEAVARMSDVMRHAGPDSHAQWTADPISLGHCMSRATAEAGERQPLVSPCGSVVLVWDGRLDNGTQLRGELRRLGRQPRDASDAELALLSFVAWGTDCVRRFVGDFALAAWDIRRRELFCARDHVGARPLHYAATDRYFAFASLDEALLQVPGVSAEVDERRVAYFLAPEFQGFDFGGSWLRDVRVLGAGQWLLVRPDGKHEVHTYWEPACAGESKFASEEDCARQFLEVFDEAVKCRLQANGDVALMLSGGLDSAAILAACDSVDANRLHTYSAVSDNAEDDVENAAIRALTRGRRNAHILSLPACTGALEPEDLVDTIRQCSHPVDHSVLLPALLCRAAARKGQRVMLTGVCGDLATQPSYPYIAGLLRQGRWREAHAETRAARHHTFLHDARPLGILARSAYHCFAPVALKRIVRTIRASHEAPLRNSLIHPDFAQRIGVAGWLRDLHLHVGPFSTDARLDHLKSLGPPHGTAACMGAYNRVASRWGVEVRDPWADRRVLEFWLQLPSRYKYRDGWTKYLVRRAFAQRLPEAVVHRHLKKHVGWNIAARFIAGHGPETRQSLEDALACVDNFVDVEAASRVYARYLATGSYDDGVRVFDALTLSSWIGRCRTLPK